MLIIILIDQCILTVFAQVWCRFAVGCAFVRCSTPLPVRVSVQFAALPFLRTVVLSGRTRFIYSSLTVVPPRSRSEHVATGQCNKHAAREPETGARRCHRADTARDNAKCESCDSLCLLCCRSLALCDSCRDLRVAATAVSVLRSRRCSLACCCCRFNSVVPWSTIPL